LLFTETKATDTAAAEQGVAAEQLDRADFGIQKHFKGFPDL